MRAEKRKAYTSGLSNEEWIRIRPLIQADSYFGQKSRTKFSRREMLNAIFYVLRTGCQRRDLPNDFPRQSAVYMQFDLWEKKGMHDHLRAVLRDTLGRAGASVVGIADSQRVKKQ